MFIRLNMSQTYRAPVVRRAFSVLELLSGREHSLSLSELSRGLGIGKSTVLGIVTALEDVGAVVRDPLTRRYSLGLRLLELGGAVQARLDLKDLARPILEDVAARTRETVFLGVRSGDHVTILDSIESTQELKIASPVGTRIPLLAGATGKVFLAALPEDQARKLLRAKGLRRFTDKTITDPARYLEALADVRRDGWALDDEEYIPGVRAVAAPIPDGGQRDAAIWVVGFTPSMDLAKMRSIAKRTRAAAEAIGRRAHP